MDAIFGGLVVLGAIFLYFLPVYIARKRQHPQFTPIWVITLLLGWTVLGWIAALAWSLANFQPKETPQATGEANNSRD